MKAQHNALVNVGRDLDEPITDGGIMSAVGHHASTLYPEHVQAFRMYWKGIISRLESTSYTKIPEMAYRGHLRRHRRPAADRRWRWQYSWLHASWRHRYPTVLAFSNEPS